MHHRHTHGNSDAASSQLSDIVTVFFSKMTEEDDIEERALATLMECHRTANDDRPSSFFECLRPDFSIDLNLHAQLRQKEDDLEDAKKNSHSAFLALMEHEEAAFVPKRCRATKQNERSCKLLRPHCFDQEGNIKHLKPRETFWHIVHCADDQQNTAHQADVRNKLFGKFRRRFWMPFAEFRKLPQRIKNHESFARWNRPDATGSPPSPMGLLLLGSLRHLGRGLAFDDLEEHTATSEETHRQFFHCFVRHGETVLFPHCV